MSVCRDGDGIASPLKPTGQHVAVHFVVVNDEQGALGGVHVVASLFNSA
jgi:hypothetical protein